MDEPALLLRIFVGEADKHHHEALYKHLVRWLREHGVAGATAHIGIMGFGAHSVLHAPSPLDLSRDLPVIIEAIDSASRIEGLIPELTALVGGGLVVTQEVRVRHRAP